MPDTVNEWADNVRGKSWLSTQDVLLCSRQALTSLLRPTSKSSRIRPSEFGFQFPERLDAVCTAIQSRKRTPWELASSSVRLFHCQSYLVEIMETVTFIRNRWWHSMALTHGGRFLKLMQEAFQNARSVILGRTRCPVTELDANLGWWEQCINGYSRDETPFQLTDQESWLVSSQVPTER
jgi:hypothetical protein